MENPSLAVLVVFVCLFFVGWLVGFVGDGGGGVFLFFEVSTKNNISNSLTPCRGIIYVAVWTC